MELFRTTAAQQREGDGGTKSSVSQSRGDSEEEDKDLARKTRRSFSAQTSSDEGELDDVGAPVEVDVGQADAKANAAQPVPQPSSDEVDTVVEEAKKMRRSSVPDESNGNIAVAEKAT